MQNNKFLIVSIIVFSFVMLIFFTFFNGEKSLINKIDHQTKASNLAEEKIIPAQKLEVIDFHTTACCVSCLRIEEFTQNTLADNFASELASGQITFQSINVDLPENKDLAKKYQVAGTALFINAILPDNSEKSKQYNRVWNYLNDQETFKTYLSTVINQLLGRN